MINDILENQRLEEKKVQLERQPFLLSNVLSDSLDVVSSAAREKDLELVADFGMTS